MLPRSFLTKCSSLLSLVLRAWVVLIYLKISPIQLEISANQLKISAIQ